MPRPRYMTSSALRLCGCRRDLGAWLPQTGSGVDSLTCHTSLRLVHRPRLGWIPQCVTPRRGWSPNFVQGGSPDVSRLAKVGPQTLSGVDPPMCHVLTKLSSARGSVGTLPQHSSRVDPRMCHTSPRLVLGPCPGWIPLGMQSCSCKFMFCIPQVSEKKMDSTNGYYYYFCIPGICLIFLHRILRCLFFAM